MCSSTDASFASPDVLRILSCNLYAPYYVSYMCIVFVADNCVSKYFTGILGEGLGSLLVRNLDATHIGSYRHFDPRITDYSLGFFGIAGSHHYLEKRTVK